MMIDDKVANIASYEDIASALLGSTLDMSAAEIHGTICGLLCNEKDITLEKSLELIFDHKKTTSSLPQKTWETILNLFVITNIQLQSPDLSLELLLPEDDVDLNLRVEAFSDWCRAFIHGLNKRGFDLAEIVDPDVRDAVLQIADFSYVDCEDVEDSNDEERSYMELVEYLRVAVLMIYGEFSQFQEDIAKHSISQAVH